MNAYWGKAIRNGALGGDTMGPCAHVWAGAMGCP